MDYQYILSEKERVSRFEGSGERRREKVGHVAFLTMNRPEVLNAMNRQLTEELHDAVRCANADPEIGCIVITGADTHPRVPAFSAGGDIHEQREDQAALNSGTLSRDNMDERAARRQRGGYEVSASDKPVIGMINGLAYGGGAVLSSSLDIRIGSDAARFRFLAAAYGRINSTWTLTNQVGWPQAKELLFTARIVEAEEAHRIGLLNHLVPTYRLRQKNDGGGRRDCHQRYPVGNRHQATAAATYGRQPGRPVDQRKRLHHQRAAGHPGRGSLPGLPGPPGPAGSGRRLIADRENLASQYRIHRMTPKQWGRV